MTSTVQIHCGDCLDVLRTMSDESVNCCVTSPPYWGQRDYGVDGQFGLEATPEEYVEKMVEVFREARRVLRKDGTCWVNLGDVYCSQGGSHDGRDDNQPGVGAKQLWRNGSGRADGIVDDRGQRNRNGNTVVGLKPKNLVGIPWRVAFALQADGWYLRQDIIWAKPNPMPESVTDRCTKAHEYIFLLTKCAKYWYDAEAIKEPDSGQDHHRTTLDGQPSLEPSNGLRSPHRGIRTTTGRNGLGRNKRSVWTISTASYFEAHFATFPPKLVEPCILAGCPSGGTVLDPFAGSGTTGMVALEHGRNAILIELNPEYVKLIKERTNVTPAMI